MEQRLKQRLIGAVVLVALAVIFVPMLLQGPVERHPTDIPIEIPPKPAVNTTPPTPAAEQPVAPVASAPFTPSQPADAAADPSSTPEPQPEQTEPTVAEAPAPTAPVSAQEPLDTASRTPSDLAAWAVQVGSFGTESNARGLRDSLRKKGYTAYVESIKANGNTFYRVRVGPTAQREEAERLQAALAKKESMKGLVVPHP